eukprot:223105-Prorocentrum_minimum.AAC.2
MRTLLTPRKCNTKGTERDSHKQMLVCQNLKRRRDIKNARRAHGAILYSKCVPYTPIDALIPPHLGGAVSAFTGFGLACALSQLSSSFHPELPITCTFNSYDNNDKGGCDTMNGNKRNKVTHLFLTQAKKSTAGVIVFVVLASPPGGQPPGDGNLPGLATGILY